MSSRFLIVLLAVTLLGLIVWRFVAIPLQPSATNPQQLDPVSNASALAAIPLGSAVVVTNAIGSAQSNLPAIVKTDASAISTTAPPAVTATVRDRQTNPHVASQIRSPPQVPASTARNSANAFATTASSKIVGGGNYGAYKSEVARLGPRLTAKEIADIYAFLSRPAKEFVTMDAGDVNSIKNDLVERLITQDRMPADLTTRLKGWYSDGTMDPMFRNYCLQLLGSAAVQSYVKGQANAPGIGLAKSTLQSALYSAEPMMADAALSGLKRLAEFSGNPSDMDAVARSAVSIANNDGLSPSVRANALNVAIQTGHAEVLPVARRLVTATTNTTLQLACIATIGACGNSSDIATLQKVFHDSSSVYQRQAAGAALVQIDARR